MPGNFRDLKYCKITHLQWLLISFLFISQTVIYSQVRIREKLEISPKPKDSLILNKTASASHTMRISAHWHTDVTANIQAKMIVRDIFGDNAVVASSDWVAGRPEGDITLTISNAVCYYDVEIQFKGFTNNYQSADVKTNVYWDDMLVSVYNDRAISFWDYGYQFGSAGYYAIYPFWIADFRAGYEPYIQDNYCFEMPVRINDLISDGPVYYPNKDSLAITILKGDDLFWFYDLNTGERYEKTITGLPTFFMSYNLVPKGPLPIKDSVEIVLQFQIKDDIKTLSHMLYNLNNGYVYTYCNGSQRVSYKDKKEIEAYIMNDCGNVPADAVLKAEIKKGSEYGTLIDAFSGSAGDVLTNLDMSNGYADVLFFANGKEPAGEDTVIIEWTTSKDNIRRDVDALIVERAPIKISLIPPEISPGDTALIKLQKWDYSSGSYSDFPEGQTYEIGIQDGCGLGYILLPDSTRNNYYKGNYSPEFTLKFVASDSLDSDSLSVDFRAGYPNGIYGLASPVRMSVTKSALSKDGSSAGIKKLDDGERQTELYKAISQEMSNDRRFNSLSEVARGTMLAKLKERIEKAPAAEKSLMIGGGDDGGYGQTCAGVSYIYPEKGSGSELIVRPTEIMLGETKYFQTKLNENNELVIEEVKADLGAEPQCTGIKEDVWGDNPVTPATLGNKCGVYWEKKYPIYLTDQYEGGVWVGKKYKESTNLKKGLIRLVGRYWENGKEDDYKVCLTATYMDKKTMKNIKVVKPMRLLSSKINSNDAFFLKEKNAKDELGRAMYEVTNNKSIFDEKCIEYGGKLGIPPQIIKGQIQEESSFEPVLLYEPYRDAEFCERTVYKDFLKNSCYTITEDGKVGDPIPPTNHRIKYWGEYHSTYPGYLKSIYDVWASHPKTYSNIEFVYPQIYKNHWKVNVNTFEQDIINRPWVYGLKGKSKEEIIKYAKSKAVEYAEKDWPDYLKDRFCGGMKSYTAQTRINTSYGFLQSIYYDACEKNNYPADKENLPENLMLTDVSFKYSTKYLSIKLKTTKNENWKDGYESGWKQALYGYNGGSYRTKVLRNAVRYLPQ